jgi:hypothetical protein
MLMGASQEHTSKSVRAGLVVHPEEYRWSSARCWNRRILEDEPLLMDIDQLAGEEAEAQPPYTFG